MWSLPADGEDLLVTPAWRHYVTELVVNADASTLFDMGLTNADGSVWIDGLTVTRGAPSPVWRRDFERGLVLVNPTSAPVAVTIGSGYRRLSGSQDPATNSGGAAPATVMVPAWDAVILRR